MRRDQWEHSIRTACQIIGHDAVAVVGSRAILGSFAEDQLPAEATMSMEADILPLVQSGDEAPGWPTSSRASRASGRRLRSSTASASMGSTGRPPCCRLDGVIASSKSRREHVSAVRQAAVYIGWCLDKEDLCVAKLCALREKDQNFVAALLDAGLVSADVIAGRLPTVPEPHLAAAERALAWLAART